MKKSILPSIGVIVYLVAFFADRYVYNMTDTVYYTICALGILLVLAGFVVNVMRNNAKNKKEQ